MAFTEITAGELFFPSQRMINSVTPKMTLIRNFIVLLWDGNLFLNHIEG
jgi:hypothetical protein